MLEGVERLLGKCWKRKKKLKNLSQKIKKKLFYLINHHPKQKEIILLMDQPKKVIV